MSYAGLAGNRLLFSSSKLYMVGLASAFLVSANDLSCRIHSDNTCTNLLASRKIAVFYLYICTLLQYKSEHRRTQVT